MSLPPKNLNPGPCPPHPISTYTCGVIIAPRVYGSRNNILCVRKLCIEFERELEIYNKKMRIRIEKKKKNRGREILR